MPIPEPSIYRPSNLTKQQKQDQLAACYGVVSMPELTFEEVERMRQIVHQHDAQRQPMQTIDLNNPKPVPYRFQKFPMMVYGDQPGLRTTVESEVELEEAIANGWTKTPQVADEPQAPVLSAQYQGEVNRLNEQLEHARRRKPRSTEAA